MSRLVSVTEYYDLLAAEDNDPVYDGAELREYMNGWDGDEFIELLGLTDLSDVLEIGVGTGRLAVRVAPKCHSLCGVDISPCTIEKARINLKYYDNVSLICADICHWMTDSRYDVVYSSLTLMHIKDKHRVIECIASLVNSGGRAVLSLDRADMSVLEYGDRAVKIYPDTVENIASLLQKYGMTVTDIVAVERADIVVAQKL